MRRNTSLVNSSQLPHCADTNQRSNCSCGTTVVEKVTQYRTRLEIIRARVLEIRLECQLAPYDISWNAYLFLKIALYTDFKCNCVAPLVWSFDIMRHLIMPFVSRIERLTTYVAEYYDLFFKNSYSMSSLFANFFWLCLLNHTCPPSDRRAVDGALYTLYLMI